MNVKGNRQPSSKVCRFSSTAPQAFGGFFNVRRKKKTNQTESNRQNFEFYKDNGGGRKAGVTCETFQLGKSYINRLSSNRLLRDGAPPSAIIYSVKTKFIKREKLRRQHDSPRIGRDQNFRPDLFAEQMIFR